MKKRVCEGRISSPFGMRKHPVTGKRSMHNGVDVACAVGTPVFSPCNGMVLDVYEHARGGLTVIVIGDGGVRYGFCHLEVALVITGARVSKGTPLALTGDSGVTTGPHLHYSQKRCGKWEEPELMIEV